MRIVIRIACLSLIFAAVMLAPATSWSQQLDLVKVGIIPIADTLGVYAANEKGFFAENRIKVEMNPSFAGARIIEAIAAGEWQIGLSATVSAIQANSRGLDIVAIAPATAIRLTPPGSNAIMTRKDSGIDGAKDLVGKRFAVNVISSIVYMLGAEYVSRAGLDPGKVNWVELPFPQMPPALLNRTVDALDTVEPYVTVLNNSGEAKILAYDADIFPGLSMAVWVGSEKWIKANRDVVERFVRAYRKGVEYVNSNPEYVRQALKKDLKLDPKLADQMVLHVMKTNLEEREVTGLVDVMRKHKLLDRPFDVKRFIYETAR